MEVIFSVRHASVTNEMKEYIEEKLRAALESKPLKISSVRVVLDAQKNRQKAEVIVNIKNFNAEAQAESYDMYESMDTVVEKITTQVKRRLDKLQDHKHTPSMRDTVKIINLDLKKEDEEEEDI